MWKVLLGWSAAVFTAMVSGSLIQTQINLAAIARLGAPVGLKERLSVSWFDLTHFAPLWAVLVAGAFLPAFLVAGAWVRHWPGARGALFPLAGFAAVLTVLALMAAALPVTVIAAARSLGGLLLRAVCGGLGGWIYLRVNPQRQRGPA